MPMREGLILSRKEDEQVVIDLRKYGAGLIYVGVVEVRNLEKKVRLMFSAPRDIPVHRLEIFDAIERQGATP